MEKEVRAAAARLCEAIAAAEKAGYRVQWPASAAGLAAIAISETARVVPQPPPIPAAKSRASAPTTPKE